MNAISMSLPYRLQLQHSATLQLYYNVLVTALPGCTFPGDINDTMFTNTIPFIQMLLCLPCMRMVAAKINL